jgi:hypothetical protein
MDFIPQWTRDAITDRRRYEKEKWFASPRGAQVQNAKSEIEKIAKLTAPTNQLLNEKRKELGLSPILDGYSPQYQKTVSHFFWLVGRAEEILNRYPAQLKHWLSEAEAEPEKWRMDTLQLYPCLDGSEFLESLPVKLDEAMAEIRKLPSEKPKVAMSPRSTSKQEPDVTSFDPRL